MARSKLEIKLTNKKPEEISRIVESVVSKYGYASKIVSGERVWAKGDGVMRDVQCFSLNFRQDAVIVEAWFKNALLGESDLTGIAGAIPKKKAKEIMAEIVSAIEEM